ncbi:uncharacterized protein LOC110442626 [Mizuhopecten yessoensis]|uniref:Transcription intermediary factor 1-beta n=1 Tax=Mizuhopecten yessoensis TaxID=6573 RepID=A0A210PGT7_MIZYE|nr:uncharacterized protein LOC110442626 [Mizuhopecten yessoensis]OWF35690.1 Transcription intermediary factor 1-beta [Mizuhopecten yessoensis]
MASNRSVLRAQEAVIYTCSLCDSDFRVRWYCNDCRETLCDRCKEAHQLVKNIRNHVIISIGDAKCQSNTPVAEVCKLHPGKRRDLYCSDCDIIMCSMCLSQEHREHDWRHFDEEFTTQKQKLKEHMKAIATKIEQFEDKISNRQRFNKDFEDAIDTVGKAVNSQRAKVKAEVDYLADAVLYGLSFLQKEESMCLKTDCQRSEENVQELKGLLRTGLTATSNESVVEMQHTLAVGLTKYDVGEVLPRKTPTFLPGSVDNFLFRKTIGTLHTDIQYQKIDINSKHVHCLCTFTVLKQRNQVFSICPTDDRHAWLSICDFEGLALVNSEGLVIETVDLTLSPYRIAMLGSTDILITRYGKWTSLYKLTLHTRCVTEFADISPHTPRDISINESGEVFVSTGAPTIVVLDYSGNIIKQFPSGTKGWDVACLSAGGLAVSVSKKFHSEEILFQTNDGKISNKWAGDLENGKNVEKMHLCKMSRDRHDRLFVPDFNNNQVYVLSGNGMLAACLLEEKHGVEGPTAVGVDTCGDVWVGCGDGTVHVMRL